MRGLIITQEYNQFFKITNTVAPGIKPRFLVIIITAGKGSINVAGLLTPLTLLIFTNP